MKFILLPAFLLLTLSAFAQDNSFRKDTAEKIDLTQVYTYVEQMPEAGYDFLEFFAKNFQYPDSA